LAPAEYGQLVSLVSDACRAFAFGSYGPGSTARVQIIVRRFYPLFVDGVLRRARLKAAIPDFGDANLMRAQVALKAMGLQDVRVYFFLEEIRETLEELEPVLEYDLRLPPDWREMKVWNG
jgi:hypothetical protein